MINKNAGKAKFPLAVSEKHGELEETSAPALEAMSEAHSETSGGGGLSVIQRAVKNADSVVQESILQQPAQQASASASASKPLKELTTNRTIQIRESILRRMERLRTNGGVSFNWLANTAIDKYILENYPQYYDN